MDLEQFTDTMTRERQWEVAVALARLTLPIWDTYAEKEELRYIDTVVGMTHTVEKQLLKATIDEVERYSNPGTHLFSGDEKLNSLRLQYDDPVVALQDNDWELPDAVQKTFYSVYNLLEATAGKAETIFDEKTIYVSINQSIDALLSSNTKTIDEIREIIGWRMYENGSRAS